MSEYKTDNAAKDHGFLELIIRELEEGFKIFEKGGKFLSVFGSARAKESSPEYILACEIGAEAAKAGFSIVTGGGPGIMEAAARGAFLKGSITYGVNVKLPHEQGMNPYIRAPYFCRYLFTRKILLTCNSSGFIVMPGGFGTLDELFEIVTLMATSMNKTVPVILAVSSYWDVFYGWIRNEMMSRGFIAESELNIIKVIDDPKEIIKVIVDFQLK